MSETQQSEPQLCKNCYQFFGNPEKDYLCSKCFQSKINPNKDNVSKNQQLPDKIEEETKIEPKPIENIDKQEDKSKCWNCSRKVGVLGFACKCGFTFCKFHRLPEEHECNFDFSKAAREKLKSDNPLIKANKLDKM